MPNCEHACLLQQPQLFKVPIVLSWLRLPVQLALLWLIEWSTRRPSTRVEPAAIAG